MSTNGTSDPAEVYRRHFQSVAHHQREAAQAEQTAQQLRAEAERLSALAQDWATRSSDMEARAARAGAGDGELHRSKMTAKQKSDFITKHGKEAYFAIPW